MRMLLDEFKKINKANYFVFSFLIMFLSPLFTLFLLSLNKKGFSIGDFNQLNIIFLSLIGTKTIFPLLGMLSIHVETENSGWAGLCVTPVRRMRYIWVKVVFVILWSFLLMLFSIFVVILTEVLLFNDYNIIYDVYETFSSYAWMMLYIIPHIIFGMTLAFILKSLLIPCFIVALFGVFDYVFQVFNPSEYLPSYIPRYIMHLDKMPWTAYSVLYIMGIISLLTLLYLVEEKDL